MEMVEGGDGTGQVTLGMVKLFDVPRDLFHLSGSEFGSNTDLYSIHWFCVFVFDFCRSLHLDLYLMFISGTVGTDNIFNTDILLKKIKQRRPVGP